MRTGLRRAKPREGVGSKRTSKLDPRYSGLSGPGLHFVGHIARIGLSVAGFSVKGHHTTPEMVPCSHIARLAAQSAEPTTGGPWSTYQRTLVQLCVSPAVGNDSDLKVVAKRTAKFLNSSPERVGIANWWSTLGYITRIRRTVSSPRFRGALVSTIYY